MELIIIRQQCMWEYIFIHLLPLNKGYPLLYSGNIHGNKRAIHWVPVISSQSQHWTGGFPPTYPVISLRRGKNTPLRKSLPTQCSCHTCKTGPTSHEGGTVVIQNCFEGGGARRVGAGKLLLLLYSKAPYLWREEKGTLLVEKATLWNIFQKIIIPTSA